jgi:methionyl-tRNA formyltransferase
MRLVFMGTPVFAAYALHALLEAKHEIACVYSQPPRPAGRGYELKKSAVHEVAESHGLEVRTPLSLKDPEEQKKFMDLNADAAVVVAYGLLLPKAILEAPRYGCFNIHASLLPRWRGAAPIQRAIMAGDTEMGISIMRMEEGLDTGPVVHVQKIPIMPSDTSAALFQSLALMGGHAIVEAIKTPDAPGVPQPADGVTYAKKILKEESHIDFSQSADTVRNQIHGLSDQPGAWFSFKGERIKVESAMVAEGSGTPGFTLDGKLRVACGSGAVQLLELKRAGKDTMDFATLLRGFPIPAGAKLD